MNGSLQRLLNPSSLAVVGGHWADAIIEANKTLGYVGSIRHVHPSREGCFRSIEELPESPDATFVGVLARQVPGIARQLKARDAGGFVCFASGFEEVGNSDLTQDLIDASAGMAYFGTNCYGFINYFDGVALWPDKVSRQRPDRGVAIICQSGGVGIGITHSRRSLPIGYLISIGNQTQIGVEDLIEEMVQDARVSAFGLYIEGIRDIDRFKRAVAGARAAGKPVALIKAGRTQASASTAVLHTASITGNDAEFDALCSEFGIARCETLGTLIETLKIFHLGGPLRGNRVLTMAASAGYAILTSDVARNFQLDLAALPPATNEKLNDILGPRIVISNPFDFQTLYWHDRAKMRAMFIALFEAGYDAIALMFGYPPDNCEDTSGYDMPINEFMEISKSYETRAMVLAPLPEFFNVELRGRCIQNGVVPLQGHSDGLQALSLAALKPG